MFRLPAAIRLLLVAAAVLALQATATDAAKRPKYGGTLRVELHEATVTLDPREWRAGSLEAATNEKLAALVFDRLVALDNYGRFQPQLASEWTHDASLKRWQFTLRQGVKFSDGSPLTTVDVVTALQTLLPAGLQVLSSGATLTVQSNAAMPDLVEQLASGRYFIFRVRPDATLLGTGPFFVAGSSKPPAAESNTATDSVEAPHAAGSATHLHFRANEETWSGRPFLHAIDVLLGVPALRRLFDLQLGNADVVELSPELARRAMQENVRVWSSWPVTLFALRFDDAQAAVSGARFREAISLSLDRGTMAGVLLQKQAEPASALLPQWLSGYAFLFTMEANLEHAREIRATLPTKLAAGTEPLRLRIDARGELPKLLGERVAINARQANILVQIVNGPAQRAVASLPPKPSDPPSGLRLIAWRYSSLSPRAELDAMVAAQHLAESSESAPSTEDSEQLYARERRLLDDRRVLPIVTLPEYVGLGPAVRDWVPARWGEWRLADVWLDVREPAASPSGGQPSAKPPSAQPQALVPGARP